jgi:insertion element IS1 protein InsB
VSDQRFAVSGGAELIDRLLLERVPRAGIARVFDISERRLQVDVNAKLASVAQRGEMEDKKQGR